MGDWRTVMPESSLGSADASLSSSRPAMSPLGLDIPSSIQCSLLSKHSYNILGAFCTEDNVAQCISYVNQELSSLGFAALCSDSNGKRDLSLVTVLNVMYELLQLHRRGLRSLEDMETEQLKSSSDLDHLHVSNSRLKDQLEQLRRENTALHERERQMQLKIKSLQNCLKNDKEEIQKLQNIIASRATQYNHDMKRKEREYTKLKERLHQLLMDKKDKKLAIEVLNYVGRSDGKRSLWKTGKTEARNEGEMYKTLLSDYECRQKDLMGENAELKKVLQQMKKEMMSILSPKKLNLKEKVEDSLEQALSDNDEEGGDHSREVLELSCEHAREQLTNSIRQQWRRLKNHVEQLDNQASLVQKGAQIDKDVIAREIHEEEMEKLKLEIQQCKDFIKNQQQLWQLTCPCDDETAALLHDCYLLEEKERLKEEWDLFDEQRRNFEKERRNFTEAAIRLGNERKVFEDDRATWLKQQFLNITPFADRKRPQTSKSQSALSVSTETELWNGHTPAQLTKSVSHTGGTPKSATSKMPSTVELYRTLRLIPDPSSSRTLPKKGSWQDSNIIHTSEVLNKSRHSTGSDDNSIYSLAGDENTPN
ncbi:synovial sarcoma, X breakpoint 2 interacting protein a isoform X2 [Lepisosteus oculatus]|uniref:synovial sarcoma, X breakpoint 2 interacting protein a isoform X2 n=1 Tax=Lepisosteus oculatus TaxID=7918 RepID=UPI00074044E1|nr:PREDICTED: afadin- and alpha-actinin-binding protein isoform X2 [Lepisosteus oculatus]